MMKIQLKNIQFSYDHGSNALEDVSLEVKKRELVSIVGPNGSGKSTLLKCINRILKPRRGSILVNGKEVWKFQLKELARILGYVPQVSNHFLSSCVFDTVLLGRRPYINWRLNKRDEDVVLNLLKLMNLEGLMLRQFNELSGGEQQKVIIARALAQEPQILLIDEPTSNLDLKHQIEILTLILSAIKEKGLSAIMAIHDLSLAARFSDRIVLLKEGRIYTEGEPNKVLTKKNLKEVYGVEVDINYDSGIPHIIPLFSVEAS
jgi:iron complex transport system ATP-binding protein